MLLLLMTTVFTVLLLPMITVLLPPLFSLIITWFVVLAGFVAVGFVTTGFVTTGFVITGFVIFGAVIFFLGVGVFSHGQRLLRADSQSSKRSFTTAKESVNLWFSCNKYSTTDAAQSSSS